MAFTRVQGGSNDSAGATSISVTLSAVGSGNCVCGVLTYDAGGGDTLTSVDDNKGNTYNLETSIKDTTDNQYVAAFSLTNITNAPTVITAHFSPSTTVLQLVVDEFSGGSTASSDERDGAAHGGQFQNSPGTGTDGVTSGTFTTSTNGDLIWGGCEDTAGARTLCSNGTSFSTGTQDTGPIVAGQTEYRTQTIAGSGTAATFTQAANTQRITFMIAIKPPGGGAAAAPTSNIDSAVPPRPRNLGQTWTQAYNQNLVGKDVLPPGRKGINFDLSPKRTPPAGPTWTSRYNSNLIGKDVFPPGRRGLIYEEVQPVLWRREWTQNLLLTTLAQVQTPMPFRQRDWPLPQRATQPDRSWVSSAASLQLILPPPGEISTDLPPRPQSWRSGWTCSLVLSTLVGQDSFPPGQISTGVVLPVPWRRDWTQNLVLTSTVVAAPFGPYDCSVRLQPAVLGQTWTQNLLLSTLAAAAPLPLNQFSWPLPQAAAQPSRGFSVSYNLNLIAQDRLPFRQSDWPLPKTYVYPASVRASQPLNPNLFPPPPPPVVLGEFRNPPVVGVSPGQMGTWGTW